MDPVTARFKVLKLAALSVPGDDLDRVLDLAKAWTDFVLPPGQRESSGKNSKGDDAARAPTHVP